MIGYLDKPTGRMGNVMIQYAFLRQISEYSGIDYFHIKLPYRDNFTGWNVHNISLKLLLSKKMEVHMKDVEKLGIDKFIALLKEKDAEGYTIVLKPPMLGHLFEFKNSNPGQYFIINEKYCIGMRNDEGKNLIGMHFRGTDFYTWNEKAVLPFEYYREAMEHIRKEYRQDQIRVLLFTDDNNFETYVKTLSYLKKQNYDVLECSLNNSMMVDFYQLSQCDIIVSSPSTYAIMAAITGKQGKKIIHNRKWVEYCADKGEMFWIDILDNKVPYYKVCALL